MGVRDQVRWWVAAGAGMVVVVVGGILWLGWDAEPEPRARQYRDYDVCLLTGGQGLADATARAAWEGMQQVSLERSVRVSYLEVVGDQSTQRAEEFLSTLVQQDCDVIVAVGDYQVAAATARKAIAPDRPILLVGRDGIDASSPETTTKSIVDALRGVVRAE